MPRKTCFRLLRTLCFLCLAFPVATLALPPPGVIEETNRKAQVIVLGRVLAVTPPSSDQPFFELEVTSVIKGLQEVEPGDKIKVRFTPESVQEGGFVRRRTGVIPVRVQEGRAVKAYLNPSRADEESFEPVLQGSSVMVLPEKEKGPLHE